jgi:hypothetical protein
MNLLIEARSETERLLSAGAGLAAGDFRVKRLLSAFDEAAAAAPVLARVGAALRRAVDDEPSAEAAADALMEAHSLLAAIAATQTESALEGELERPGSSEDRAGAKRAKAPQASSSRSAGYGIMKPISEALASSGQGRLAVLERAQEEGLLADLRLLPDLVAALGDGSVDVAAIARKALAALGPAAVPALRSSFDPALGAAAQRSLELLAASGGIDEEGLARLARGTELAVSPQVRAAAIAALAELGLAEGSPREELLLGLAADRKKEVRLAAAAALCRSCGAAAAEAVASAVAQEADPDLARAAGASASPYLAARLLAKAKAELDAALDSLRSGKPDKKAVERCLASLEPLPVREGSPAHGFLFSVCASLDPLAAGPERDMLLDKCLARLLASEGAPRQALLAIPATAGHERLAFRFYASLLEESPVACFQRFAPILAAGRGDPLCAALLDAWRSMTSWLAMSARGLPGFSGVESYDARWREEFCRLDELDLVCRFEGRGMPKNVMRYLEKKAERPGEIADSLEGALRSLARAGSSRCIELCVAAYRQSLAPKQGKAWMLSNAAEAALAALEPERARELERLAAKEKDQALADFLARAAKRLAGEA